MDGWKMNFLLGWPNLRGYVSFREGKNNFKQAVKHIVNLECPIQEHLKLPTHFKTLAYT